ncbi:MAG: hypothetical protein KF708_20120 [Pirellulales bacterium]|nr:hypothetical protein [Pirellulales bacterium]
MSSTLDYEPQVFDDQPQQESQRPYRLAFVALAFIVFFFLVMLGAGSTKTELTIELRNRGDQPMRNVVVRLPDASRVMGFLAAGGERSVRTRATRNAPVQIEYLDGRGRLRNLTTSVRLQPGEVGTVRIDLSNTRVLRVYKETRVSTRS